MVIPMKSVCTAISSFIETDIIPKAPQDRRLLLGAAALIAPKWIEKQVQENSEYLEMLGIMTGEGLVDTDKAEGVATSLLDKYGNYTLAMKNVTVSIGKDDVSRIVELSKML